MMRRAAGARRCNPNVDPLTAALTLATAIVNLCVTVIESQPPELRAAIALQQWDDFQHWRAFFEQFKVKA